MCHICTYPGLAYDEILHLRMHMAYVYRTKLGVTLCENCMH
jgi:hypothetical protein